jgi:hypothetical protein
MTNKGDVMKARKKRGGCVGGGGGIILPSEERRAPRKRIPEPPKIRKIQQKPERKDYDEIK